MELPMAIVVVMMSSKQKSPTIPQSQEEAHTMSRKFAVIPVSNSKKDLRFVQARSVGMMVGCQTFRKCRYGGHCLFGCSFTSLLFSSVYPFSS